VYESYPNCGIKFNFKTRSKLKQQPGQDILVEGSGNLVDTLMRYDLIDEYRLMVFPIVLGSGKRFFKDGSYKKVLKLVDVKTFISGVVVLSYKPDGKKKSEHGNLRIN
jgi:dihydrofolate reductase